jgi:catechol 2,3-dioxygenase-like lactoylglutathione lyase family enzyme
MQIHGLLHFNIRCSPADLETIKDFYRDVLEMRDGHRPNFGFPGAWLYRGNEPLIHISARFPEGSVDRHPHHTGSVDHIAFSCTGPDEFRRRLTRHNVRFEERNLENAGYQIFLTDPMGTKLEFNFPNSEAPSSLPPES